MNPSIHDARHALVQRDLPTSQSLFAPLIAQILTQMFSLWIFPTQPI